jgi:hypothetical protein
MHMMVCNTRPAGTRASFGGLKGQEIAIASLMPPVVHYPDGDPRPEKTTMCLIP